MKILVTGGAGFIGSHAVDAYVKKGHRVIILDNLSSGSKRNLNPQAKFYRADIRNIGLVKKIFFKEKPQIVNHHAAVSEVARSLRDPGLTYKTNILGTANVLIAAGEAKIKKFIFISTGGAVYGNPKRLPSKEAAELNPLSPYALSKLAGEEITKFYARFYNFDFSILRYANVYGPRQNPRGEAGVVAIFTDLMRRGRQPLIFGNGKATRDYVYVGDIAKANILALNKGRNRIINVGCGREIDVNRVFLTIAAALGFKKNPIYGPARRGEVSRIALDVSSAQKVLGWRPSVNFENGVLKYVEYALAKD